MQQNQNYNNLVSDFDLVKMAFKIHLFSLVLCGAFPAQMHQPAVQSS